MGSLGTGGKGDNMPLLSKAGCKAFKITPYPQGLSVAHQRVLSASWMLLTPCFLPAASLDKATAISPPGCYPSLFTALFLSLPPPHPPSSHSCPRPGL